ncbi:DNA-3-methyladenine glycosylase 2 family protein [Halorhabdus sp. CBA1104]|uniref:DNA-3-methyladenine glycosylase family protein n=1 Tax=unclassified Halorhabdus TaxID=2621901 RepID=UPI0012B3B742|nr:MULTISPECIES: DNA-3-methyladenine glycosylase [unclassified Halorhabdus]QGN06847.1 DNA-3-methyladenine glycosylase 2 family protein [Halorhabdus sp. CBA1104]
MTDAYNHLRTDPRLASLIDEHGELTVEPAENCFARLVVSIVRQQLSIESASVIRQRLFDHFEVTPTNLQHVPAADLADVGLSRQKAETITRVATVFDERDYSVSSFDAMDDEQVLEELTKISGIGPWTAKMFLLYALGREDVFPVEDLGIRRGMQALYDTDMTRTEMVDHAESWRPYRSIASLYLWRVVD